MTINDRFKRVLEYIGTGSIKTIDVVIGAFVDTIEASFRTVAGLLGVINDNLRRIENLFSGKS